MDIIPDNGDASNIDDNFRLHSLNDYCLIEIYKRLTLKDAKNLAGTSKRLENVYMYRYHKYNFEFDSGMFNKICKNGNRVLDNILLEYGPHVRSWSLTIDNEVDGNAGVEVLKTISKYSTNLKRLELKGFIYGFKDFLRDCGEAIVCFENVESLIFNRCFEIRPFELLQSFRKLKHLYFDLSGTTTRELQTIFQNNRDIESYYNNHGDSFCGDSHNFGRFTGSEFALCEFGPKFHKLCLGAYCDGLEMEQMLPLAATNLTSLKLDFCGTENLTIFLTEMAKKPILKELELRDVDLDKDGCNIIQSFQHLELLVLHPRRRYNEDHSERNSEFKLNSKFVWPKKLKRLRSTIDITDAGFISLIRQLKFLTHLQLDSFQNGKRCLKTIYESLYQDIMMYIRRPRLHILYDTKKSKNQSFIDYGARTIYPDYFKSTYRRGSDYEFYKGPQPFIAIDFSIPKCNKRKTFSY